MVRLCITSRLVMASSLLPLFVTAEACSSRDGGGGAVDAGTGTTARGGSAPGSGTGAMSGAGESATAQGGTGTSGSGTSATGGGATGGEGGTRASGAGAPGSGGAGGTSGAAGSGAGRRTGTGGAAGSPTGGTTGFAGMSGTPGAGGAAAGQTVCGTAAEDGSATLSCPDGQLIDAVTFASYGTPAGSCGSFVTGDCNATSSATMVESLCVGRSACTVPATNGAFGDPCHNTVKSLAVEVSCVPGDPATGTELPYKGVANSPASQLSALGATWCYNWGTTPKSTDCNDPYFVPMVWGGDNVAGAIQQIGAAGYKTVLGFNEPNKSDQANLTVAQALALWPDLTKNPDIRVSSPAVSDDGRAWLEDFMAQAKAKGLRVDFIAMHWYGWNAGSCVASQLEGAVNWASQWGLPVWITEFGCMGSSNPDEKTVLDFFAAVLPMLKKHPLVERYAWYPWNTYNDLYTSGGSPTMTALGQAFAAAPQYRE